MKRKAIPKSVEADLMYKSDGKCCVCRKKGHQIHHINGNPNDNRFDNLALLCVDCHDDASVKGNIIKRKSPDTIKKYLFAHYEFIENRRKEVISKHNANDIFYSQLTAGIIIEITKIKYSYFNSDSWERKDGILASLKQFFDFANYDIVLVVLRFLEDISIQTRLGLPKDMIALVHSLTIDYYYSAFNELTKKGKTELGFLCVEIGYNIAYDALIKLNNLYAAQWGLSIFKAVYKRSKGNKLLLDKVNSAFSDLESTLNRPDQIGYNQALVLIKVFKQDLSHGTLAFPPVPLDLHAIIQSHEMLKC